MRIKQWKISGVQAIEINILRQCRYLPLKFVRENILSEYMDQFENCLFIKEYSSKFSIYELVKIADLMEELATKITFLDRYLVRLENNGF